MAVKTIAVEHYNGVWRTIKNPSDAHVAAILTRVKRGDYRSCTIDGRRHTRYTR